MASLSSEWKQMLVAGDFFGATECCADGTRARCSRARSGQAWSPGGTVPSRVKKREQGQQGLRKVTSRMQKWSNGANGPFDNL